MSRKGPMVSGSQDARRQLADLLLNKHDSYARSPELRLSMVDMSHEKGKVESSKLVEPIDDISKNNASEKEKTATVEQITYFPTPQASYDPNKRPPDVPKAIKHGLCHKMSSKYIQTIGDDIDDQTGIRLNTRSLSLCCKIRDIYHYGPVLPMYFTFVKYIIFVLFLFMIGSIVTLINSQAGFGDTPSEITLNFYSNSASENYWTMTTSAFAIFFALYSYYVRANLKKVKQSCKKMVLSPSDYTIMCSNLGRVGTEQDLRNHFSDETAFGIPVDIASVSISYDIQRWVALIRRLDELITERDKLPKESIEYSKMNHEILCINSMFAENKINLTKFLGFKRSGIAFISLNSMVEAKYIRRKFQSTRAGKLFIWVMHKFTDEFPEYFFNGHQISIEKAPEIDEILWENLNSNKNNLCFGAIYTLMILILWSATLLLIYATKTSQINYYEFVMGFEVLLTNYLIDEIIERLAYFEKYRTYTEMIVNLGHRSTLITFVNTVVPFIINTLIFSTPIQVLAVESFWVGLIMFLGPILENLIDYRYLCKSRRREKFLNNRTRYNLTQQEANSLFEDPEIRIHNIIAQTLRIILYTAIFLPLNPLLGIAGFLALSMFYWVNKYNILKRSMIPPAFKSEIIEIVYDYVDISIFLLSLSSAIILNINDTVSSDLPSSFNQTVLLFISFFTILPNNKIARWNCCCCKKDPFKNENQQFLFSQLKEYLQQDYITANPVVKDQALYQEITKRVLSLSSRFECIDILSDCPELLILFNYAISRPSLPNLNKDEFQGSKNPFFLYPQNYCFSYSPLDTRPRGNTKAGGAELNRETLIDPSEMEDKVEFDVVNSVARDIALLKTRSGESETFGESLGGFGKFALSGGSSYAPPPMDSVKDSFGSFPSVYLSPININKDLRRKNY